MDQVIAAVICVFIVILSVVIVLLIPFYRVVPEKSYGKYETVYGPCISPGYRTVDYVCVPNPVTKRACLRDGKVSYATIHVDAEPCKVYTVQASWSEPQFGECVDGVQTVTRVCEKHAEKGVNECYVTTGNQGVLYSSPGDIHESTRPCSTPDDSPPGEWIFLDPYASRDLPRGVPIPVSLPFRTALSNSLYEISSQCIADGVLEAGLLSNTLACRLGDEMIIGESAWCSPYTGNNMTPCRYLPVDYRYYTLKVDGLSVMCLPSLSGSPGYHIARADMGLVISRDSLAPPTQFVFIHTNDGKAKIGLVASGGMLGFLGINTSHHLVWQQARLGPNAPGIDMNDAFEFDIEMIASTEGVKIRMRHPGARRLYITTLPTGESVRVREFIGKSWSVS